MENYEKPQEWGTYIKKEYRYEPKPPKAKKAPYRKPESIIQLQKDVLVYQLRKHPTIPENYIPSPVFRDDTANNLTKAILAHLRINGHFAARVNTTGIYDVRTKRYRRGGSTLGMADVNATVNGRAVQIEVKAGKDRPRPEQLKVAEQVRAAGGVYIFVHTFDDYLAQMRGEGLI